MFYALGIESFLDEGNACLVLMFGSTVNEPIIILIYKMRV
jgi:hypothetical protein